MQHIPEITPPDPFQVENKMSIRHIVCSEEVKESVHKEDGVQQHVEHKPGDASKKAVAARYSYLIRQYER